MLDQSREPLLAEYELEQFYPGQARRLYDLLTAPKALVSFTTAEGAQYHDAPMAPQWRNEVVFDWLEETLGPERVSAPGGFGAVRASQPETGAASRRRRG